MKHQIKRVAVLGSGVMGSGIALHLAGCGFQVLLLDMAAKDTEPSSPKAKRNAVVEGALSAALKMSPNPLYHPKFLRLIETGNFSDDMPKIASVDWIIEVVVENLAIKNSIYEQVEAYRKPGTYVSSNTSGIPIGMMAEPRNQDFKDHFIGTHFFNPPRYLSLLEIIPSAYTKPEVTEFFMEFGKVFLGKKTVLCKDTPAFIANRIGVFSIMDNFKLCEEFGFTVPELDLLTGTVIGHPKSASFRTADVVGLDTLIKVADNLTVALSNDDMAIRFSKPEFLKQMAANEWYGDKKGQGFYKKVKGEKGSDILALNLQSLEYVKGDKPRLKSIEKTKPIEKVLKRFKVLIEGDDKEAAFYRSMLGGLFAYASKRVPEISDEVYWIDEAIKAGFGWEAGIFETWDAVGLSKGIELAESRGLKVADWVYDMQSRGIASFYQKSEDGSKVLQPGSMQFVIGSAKSKEVILLQDLSAKDKLWGNAGCTLWNLGDDVGCLEFHSKMNTMGGEVVEGINRSIEFAEQNLGGLVIGNQANNFSAGANLALVLMYAVEDELDELDIMVRQFQNTMMRVRYSSVPVVVAPHGLSLGGGCEISLHSDKLVVAAETYIGLVETGVGLIPAGGGTKENALRISEGIKSGDPVLNRLQAAFMNIATAKVSTSGFEAEDLGILRPEDIVVINKERQISVAKQAAKQMADEGYVMPKPKNNIMVQGKTGLANLLVGINSMVMAGYATEYDAVVANKLAYAICGGDLSAPQAVSEQYLLDLEREAFVWLCAQRNTQLRIESILNTGKPLRN